jgi:hypothetical protein
MIDEIMVVSDARHSQGTATEKEWIIDTRLLRLRPSPEEDEMDELTLARG